MTALRINCYSGKAGINGLESFSCIAFRRFTTAGFDSCGSYKETHSHLRILSRTCIMLNVLSVSER